MFICEICFYPLFEQLIQWLRQRRHLGQMLMIKLRWCTIPAGLDRGIKEKVGGRRGLQNRRNRTMSHIVCVGRYHVGANKRVPCPFVHQCLVLLPTQRQHDGCSRHTADPDDNCCRCLRWCGSSHIFESVVSTPRDQSEPPREMKVPRETLAPRGYPFDCEIFQGSLLQTQGKGSQVITLPQ